MFEQFNWSIPEKFIVGFLKKEHQLPIRMNIVYMHNQGRVRVISAAIINPSKLKYLLLDESFDQEMLKAAKDHYTNNYNNAKPIEIKSVVQLAEEYHY